MLIRLYAAAKGKTIRAAGEDLSRG